MIRTTALTLLLLSLFFSACSFPEAELASRISYPGNTLELLDTLSAKSPEALLSKAARAAEKSSPGIKLVLAAEVTSPSLEGTLLQASHVAISPDGKYGFVSYMLKGEAYGGGIDLFDLADPGKPILLQSELFPNIDIAATAYDANVLYFAGAQSGVGAVVFSMPFARGRLQIGEPTAIVPLRGFFATDIAISGSRLFVTTGTQGGLYCLPKNDLSAIASKDELGLDNLRSVGASSGFVAAFDASLAGSASRLILYPYSAFNNADASSGRDRVAIVTGATMPEAKSRIELLGSYAILAANEAGARVIDIATGLEVAAYPVEVPTGILVENCVTNAVSTGLAGSKDVFFLANGEAGLYVGSYSQAPSWKGSLLGRVSFGSGISVNYVAGKNGMLFAATGLGGLKIIKLEELP